MKPIKIELKAISKLKIVQEEQKKKMVVVK